jgi:site-specific DNA recombinase
MNKLTRCALYTRVSSRGQLDGDYNSLDTQKERLEAYCKSQENFEVYRAYEDGAYSGENVDRPGLKAMLEDIRDRKIDCVLVYKIDRLTRNPKDFYTLLELFEKCNVNFVSITQPFETQSPTGRLIRNILLTFAQFEREMTADRTRDKMHQRAQKGLWHGGRTPYGYVNKDKKIFKHEVEAPRVEFMFKRFLEDPSICRLRTELHRREWFTRAGQHWSKSALDNMLRNPIYSGVVRFNGQTFQGQQEAIIADCIFKKAQTLRRDCTHPHQATAIERPYLLKGLIRCADCGSFMTVHYTQKKRKDGSIQRTPYYRCTKTMKYENSVCKIRHVNADDIEKFVIDKLHELSQNENYVEMTIDEANKNLTRRVEPLKQEAELLGKRLNELEAEIDSYVEALGKAKISIERLELKIEQKEGDRKALQAQYDDLKRKINEADVKDYNAELIKKALRDFRKVFKSLAPQEQTQALQYILKNVYVYPDKIALEVFELPEFTLGSPKDSEWLPETHPPTSVF